MARKQNNKATDLPNNNDSDHDTTTVTITEDDLNNTGNSKRTKTKSARKAVQDQHNEEDAAAALQRKAKRVTAAAKKAARVASAASVTEERLRATETRIAELEAQLRSAADATRDATLRAEELSRANIDLRAQVVTSSRSTTTRGPDDKEIPDDSIQMVTNLRKIGIQTAIGLEDDREQYRSIVATAHKCCNRAGLSHDGSWKQQSLLEIGQIAAAVREHHPYLRRFAGNWAAVAIIQQYFNNRRTYGNTRGTPGKSYYKRRASTTVIGQHEQATGNWSLASTSTSTSSAEEDQATTSTSGNRKRKAPTKTKNAPAKKRKVDPKGKGKGKGKEKEVVVLESENEDDNDDEDDEGDDEGDDGDDEDDEDSNEEDNDEDINVP